MTTNDNGEGLEGDGGRTPAPLRVADSAEARTGRRATDGASAGAPGPDQGAGRDAALPVDEVAQLRSQNDALRREVRMLSSALSELERVSERDTLTPLYNRRYFLTALHRRLARVRRHGGPAAIIFIDVDGLKQVNDRYGHAAGDFLLVTLAERLAGAVRANDLVARLGGDEFGLILENVTREAATAQVARLAHLVSESPARFGNVLIPMRASFGIAMLDPDQDEEDVMARADAAMYAAKQHGSVVHARNAG